MRFHIQVVSLLAITSIGQLAAQASPRFEYGSVSDLAGVTDFYVDTGMDLESRERIIENILDDLPQLSVAESAQEADVILVYGSSETSSYAGTWATSEDESSADASVTGNRVHVEGQRDGSTLSMPIYQTRTAGSGQVLQLLPGGRIRLILTYEGSKVKGSIWKKPTTKFAEKFVDAFRDANPSAGD